MPIGPTSDCVLHQLPYSLYCVDDRTPLCANCPDHESHPVRFLSDTLTEAQAVFDDAMLQVNEQTEKVDAALSYYGGLEEMFAWQKDIFLKKLNADFEVLI